MPGSPLISEYAYVDPVTPLEPFHALNSGCVTRLIALPGLPALGSKFFDAGPYRNHSFLTASTQDATDRGWAAPYAGLNALSLNGTTSFGQSNSSYRSNFSTSPITLEIFCNTRATGTGTYLMLSILNGNGLVIDGTGLVSGNGGGTGPQLSAGSFAVGLHHIVYTWDGKTGFLYHQGAQVATGTTAPQSAVPTFLYLGAFTGGFFFSALDVFTAAVYNRAISASDVATLKSLAYSGYQSPNTLVRWRSSRTYFTPSGTLAIAFDAAGNSGDLLAVSSWSGAASWNGSNRMLSIDVPFMGATGTVSAVTYGGANCTLIGTQNVVGGTGRVEQWRIIQSDPGAPAAGSNTLAVTYSGVIADTSVQWASYTNVNQTNPTEAFNGNSGINVGSATDVTVIVTPLADLDWCHFAMATSQTTGIVSSNTSRNIVVGAAGIGGNTTGADSDTGAAISPASAQTGRWTNNGTTAAWCAAGYAIRPLSAPSTSGAIIWRLRPNPQNPQGSVWEIF